MPISKPKSPRPINRMGLRASNEQYKQFLKSYLTKEGIKFYRDKWIKDRTILLYQDGNRKLGKRWIIINPYTGHYYYYMTPHNDNLNK